MKNPENLRVVIAVPSTTHWLADFAMSLIEALGHFHNARIPGVKSHSIRVVNMKGSILPILRLNSIKFAKDIQATHLICVDSDHTFPSDMFSRLLKWEKDVVAANCVTKRIPAQPTARLYDPEKVGGSVVYSDPDRIGLEKVWRVGMGVMMLSSKAFHQIPHDAFRMFYRQEADDYQGEDWTLCEALEARGIPIYVDHGLSREVGHVGTFNYSHEVVGEIIQEEITEIQSEEI